MPSGSSLDGRSSDPASSYVRTLPHPHHQHRSASSTAATTESYHHLQPTPSRIQRLDGSGLALHPQHSQSNLPQSVSSYSQHSRGTTPSYADPYRHQHQQHQKNQQQVTRSSSGVNAQQQNDPFQQWYKGGTLGRNVSRSSLLREIPLDVAEPHPTAVVFPYRGQNGSQSHQHMLTGTRYRTTSRIIDPDFMTDPRIRGGYPIGYYAADLPSTVRRVSSDVYRTSPRHRLPDAGLLIPGPAYKYCGEYIPALDAGLVIDDVTGAGLPASLLRSVSSDKGPLSVHDIAAAAAVAAANERHMMAHSSSEKQKIAVVKPIKQSSSGGPNSGNINDGRR
jgi:hypothetical protein